MNIQCPLCGVRNCYAFHHDKKRSYLRCSQCDLTFVPAEFYLTPDAEKAEYDLHQNSPDDQGYRHFLGRLFQPLCKLIPLHSNGLDFGSGPGPTLSLMFQEAGHQVAIYDYFYANNPQLFYNQYDFITATEVVEHLHHPLQELQRLWDCLKPNGYLGIMTKLAKDHQAFSNWHYKNDQTHVSFFSKNSFQWLANQWNTTAQFLENDVVIIQKTNH